MKAKINVCNDYKLFQFTLGIYIQYVGSLTLAPLYRVEIISHRKQYKE